MNIVRLRPFIPSDATQVAKLINNKKVLDNLRDFIPNPYSLQDGKDFIALTLKQDPQQIFAITCNGEVCGSIGVEIQSDIYRQSGHLGYWIGEPFWGKGIATQALKQITAYAFMTLKLARVYSSVFEYNHRSMRVLEKCGYIKEAVFSEAITKNNKLWEEHFYGLTRINFLKANGINSISSNSIEDNNANTP